MAKLGRPPKEFSEKDIEQIKVLARCHCPDSEIAAFVGCSEMTIRRHFDTLLKESREAGKANLRAKQYQLAMNGDKALLIWVGKQILGQREPSLQIDLNRIPDEQLAEIVRIRVKLLEGKKDD